MGGTKPSKHGMYVINPDSTSQLTRAVSQVLNIHVGSGHRTEQHSSGPWRQGIKWGQGWLTALWGRWRNKITIDHVYQAVTMCQSLMWSSLNDPKTIIPTLQMREERHREVTPLAWSHRVVVRAHRCGAQSILPSLEHGARGPQVRIRPPQPHQRCPLWWSSSRRTYVEPLLSCEGLHVKYRVLWSDVEVLSKVPSAARWPGFKSQLHHIRATWPQTSDSTSLCLSVLV